MKDFILSIKFLKVFTKPIDFCCKFFYKKLEINYVNV